MKSATGFRARRRLSLHDAIPPRLSNDRPLAFAIPEPPFKYIEMRDRIDTYTVLSGPTRIGVVRHDADSGCVARTTGCPNGSAPADIHRDFSSREAAARWLAQAIDGFQPHASADRRFRTYGKAKKTLAAAGLALLLATPSLAATGADPERSDAAKWVLPVINSERPIDPPPARPVQLPEPPKPSLPPPEQVLEAVTVLRLSCPQWQVGPTPGFDTEARVCALLVGHDTAYGDRAVFGSWMTAAVLGGIWLVLRLQGWLSRRVSPLRPRRTAQ